MFSQPKSYFIKKVFLPTQARLGIYLAKRLSNLQPYPDFLENFLPQNEISRQQKTSPSLQIKNIRFMPELMKIRENHDCRHEVLSKSKTILFFCPKNYGVRSSFTINQLISSAKRVNYKIQQVDIEIQRKIKPNLSLREIFLEALNETNPEIVIFNSSDSYVLSEYREFTPSLISEIRDKKKFKLINICGDLWRPEDKVVIESWSEQCDLFLHIDNFSIRSYSEEIQKKALFYPFLGLMPSRLKENQSSRRGIFYSGQVRDSDRRQILNKVLKHFSNLTKFELCIKAHYKFSEESAYSEEEYWELLHDVEICISFAQKGLDHFLIPGRSLEAIAAGCVLMHQETTSFRPMSEVLVPNLHYLPFEDFSDLRNAIKLVRNEPEKYRIMGDKASQFFRNRYTDWNLWYEIDRQISAISDLNEV